MRCFIEIILSDALRAISLWKYFCLSFHISSGSICFNRMKAHVDYHGAEDPFDPTSQASMS